jgi:hypothetical protein
LFNALFEDLFGDTRQLASLDDEHVIRTKRNVVDKKAIEAAMVMVARDEVKHIQRIKKERREMAKKRDEKSRKGSA